MSERNFSYICRIGDCERERLIARITTLEIERNNELEGNARFRVEHEHRVRLLYARIAALEGDADMVDEREMRSNLRIEALEAALRGAREFIADWGNDEDDSEVGMARIGLLNLIDELMRKKALGIPDDPAKHNPDGSDDEHLLDLIEDKTHIEALEARNAELETTIEKRKNSHRDTGGGAAGDRRYKGGRHAPEK